MTGSTGCSTRLWTSPSTPVIRWLLQFRQTNNRKMQTCGRAKRAGRAEADLMHARTTAYSADALIAQLSRKFFELTDIAANGRRGKRRQSRRSRWRPSIASTLSSPPSARSTACQPPCGWLRAKKGAPHWSPPSRTGCVPSAPNSLAPRCGRRGDRLHAHALGSLHPLSRQKAA
jgi:hypothetical protein